MPEFIVEGTPRSMQASSRGREDWKGAVQSAARDAIVEAERIEFVDVSSRIFHFCFDWGDNSGDLDNIAKPILDAISGVIFFNDNQVTELVLGRTDLRRHEIFEIEGASPLLADRIDRAIVSGDGLGFVYVSVDTEVDHRSLS